MTKRLEHIPMILLASLLLVGVGCGSMEVSDLSAEEAAATLSLAQGDEVVVRPTVLGVGGSWIEWIGGETDERVLSIEAHEPHVSVNVGWSITTEVETEASVAAREAWEAEYAETPIGIDIPDEPEPVTEEEVVRGSIESSSLADAQIITIPEFWPEGDAGIKDDSSLIWLSATQYDELVNTRETNISLGLFDQSLANVENVTDDVQGYLDAFNDWIAPLTGMDKDESAVPVEVEEEEDLTKVEASGDWGQYILTVDEVRTTVRTIEAKNNFASYTILANADNPLILEIQLTPLAQGSLEALSPTNFAEGFSGYEVTQINKTSAE